MRLNKEAVEKISSGLGEPAWLLDRRVSALKRFDPLALTELKYGLNIKTDLSGLDLGDITSLAPVKGGIWRHVDGVDVVSFSDAFKDAELEPLLKKYLFSTLKDDFFAFHSAFFNSGIVVRVKKGSVVKSPVIIPYRDDTKDHILNIFVIAEPNSSISVIDLSGDASGANSAEKDAAKKEGFFRSKLVEVFAEDGARVSFVGVEDDLCAKTKFVVRNSVVGRDAVVDWVDCCFGSGVGVDSGLMLKRNRASLVCEGASSRTLGLFFGNKGQLFDMFDEAIHSAHRTSSMMLSKGALDDSAHAVCRGLVRISEGSRFCDGNLKDDILLLCGDAKVDAIPTLEINNDEVKCSHGVAIGRVDAENLFYLMSRGIDKESAKVKIIEGFFEPIITSINDSAIEDHVRERIALMLSSYLDR
jgi:Fe-S cluster assembly protein SufD